MSFRKRSVRPNLNVSKRQIDLNSQPQADTIKKEKDSSGQGTQKQDVEVQPETQEVCIKIEESSSSTAVRKRLSKVSPKFMPHSKTYNTETCDNKLLHINLPALPDDKVKEFIAPNSNTEKDIPNLEHLDNNKLRQSKDYDIERHIEHMIKANNQLTAIENISPVNKTVDPSLGESSKNIAETFSPGETYVSEDVLKTQNIKGNRLSKRTRIMPKLTPQTTKNINKDNIDLCTDTSVKESSNKQTDEVKDLVICGYSKDIKQLPATESSIYNAIIGSDVCFNLNEATPTKYISEFVTKDSNTEKVGEDICNKPSKLQKRFKVQPKIRSRISDIRLSNVLKEEPKRNDNNIKTTDKYMEKLKTVSASVDNVDTKSNLPTPSTEITSIKSTIDLNEDTPKKDISEYVTNNNVKEKVGEECSKTSKLQKRFKVQPKIRSRISDIPTSNVLKEGPKCNDNTKTDNQDIQKSNLVLSENKILDNLNAINVEISSILSTSSPGITSNELELVDNIPDKNTTAITTTAATPKLQKRFKQQPNLSNYDKHNAQNRKNETNLASARMPSIQHANQQTSTISYSDINSKKLGNLDKGQLVGDKKELKHVRFTSDDTLNDVVYSEDSMDSTLSNSYNKLPVKSKEKNVVNFSKVADMLKSPISQDNTNGHYDSMDDDESMSEGDSLGKQLVSKNKVFKPNLAGRRRERLSSFSAYSSCDEDDWQNQKRRKKEKIHSKGDKIIKKEDEKQEKKKIRKKRLKPKDENVEPNGERVARKRRKKIKPDPAVIPKHQEERDMTTLTMQELIYYNPPSFKTVELRTTSNQDESVTQVGSVLTTSQPEEKKPKVEVKTSDREPQVMAPQIMINEDGEIVINQESLTIAQNVDDSALKSSAVVYEDSLSYGAHLKRKHVVGKRWKIDETLRFYKALSEIGTDFTLMSQAFGRFTRNELKKKFKKEEKVNCDLVDRALSNRLPLNMEMFLRGKEEMKERLEQNNNVVDDGDGGDDEVDIVAEPVTTNDEVARATDDVVNVPITGPVTEMNYKTGYITNHAVVGGNNYGIIATHKPITNNLIVGLNGYVVSAIPESNTSNVTVVNCGVGGVNAIREPTTNNVVVGGGGDDFGVSVLPESNEESIVRATIEIMSQNR